MADRPVPETISITYKYDHVALGTGVLELNLDGTVKSSGKDN